MKQAINQYRNIKGKRFIMWTADVSEFEKCKAEIKKEGLKFRIIDGQLYKEVK